MARRTAISVRRAAARANNTPATFAQAMTSTSVTMVRRRTRKMATGTLAPGTGDNDSTRRLLPRFSSGYSISSALPMASISAAAC